MLLTWSTVIAGLGGTLLAMLVFFRAKRRPGNMFFVFMSIFLALIVVANYFSLTSLDSPENTLFWIRTVMFLVPFLMLALYYFSISYLNSDYKFNLKKFLLILSACIAVAIINITPFAYLSVSISASGQIIPVTGPGLLATGFLILPLFGYSISTMLRNARKANKEDAYKIKFALYLFLISFGIQIITSFVVVSLFNYTNLVPLGSFLTFFFTVAITASILRFKLFDVNMIGSMVFVALLIVLMFAEIFSATGVENIIYKITVFIAVCFVSYQFIKNIRIEAKQRKTLEELASKLKEANQELKELDETKDNFLSMASHELNTPLSAIEGYLSMMLDEGMGGKLNKTHRGYLEKVYSSSQRLAHLVKDLLNVSRIEQGRIHILFEKGNLNKIIEQAYSEIKPEADKHKHNVVLSLNKDIPETFMDTDRITEIVINLTGNAIKYTPEGGKIEIKTYEKDKFLWFSVKDNGEGVAKEYIDNIFQKFERGDKVHDQGRGTGLGLFISKNLVEFHKGKVWVESEGEGKGSTFFFTLPILSEKPKDTHAGEGPVLRLK